MPESVIHQEAVEEAAAQEVHSRSDEIIEAVVKNGGNFHEKPGRARNPTVESSSNRLEDIVEAAKISNHEAASTEQFPQEILGNDIEKSERIDHGVWTGLEQNCGITGQVAEGRTTQYHDLTLDTANNPDPHQPLHIVIRNNKGCTRAENPEAFAESDERFKKDLRKKVEEGVYTWSYADAIIRHMKETNFNMIFCFTAFDGIKATYANPLATIRQKALMMQHDVNDHGLTELHRPAGGEKQVADIVFVHGLNGHPQHTWSCKAVDIDAAVDKMSDIDGQSSRDSIDPAHRQRNSLGLGFGKPPPPQKVFWPRDLLPKAVPKARILTWGYDVSLKHLLSAGTEGSIFHHAGQLLSDLALLRNTRSEKTIPIIFIAHSLGGIVVKDALSRSKNDTTWNGEILPSTQAIMFFGTPHHGSRTASMGTVAFQVARLFYADPNMKILRALEENSDVLDRISSSFEHVLASRPIKIHSFREGLKTRGLMIVDEASASIGYLNETKAVIQADHRDMARFHSSQEQAFQKVISILNRWIEEPAQIRRKPVPAQPVEESPLDFMSQLARDTPLKNDFDECIRSLNFVDARRRYLDVKPAYKNTYNWLFDQDIGFKSWLTGEDGRPIHWIFGKPGSGKSTLMKFAMTQTRTKDLLLEYDSNAWIITGYFFYDRGTADQKSVRGFLQEILYQMLKKRPELFLIIRQIFLDAETSNGFRSNSAWDQARIQEALSLISRQSESPLNICLFVDALNEHNGDHMDLLSCLMSLGEEEHNTNFRLRLCVAGRPENVFMDAFRGYSSFAIHDYTTSDIHHYAEDRIRESNTTQLTVRSKQRLNEIVAEIAKKADGVFLWVRLVVDELVEGLRDGLTLKELNDLLSEIPEQLEDLYTRAIRRIQVDKSAASRGKGYETYVLYQIAIHATTPFESYTLLAAAIYLSTGDDPHRELSEATWDQLNRRINSRTAGLLAPGRFKVEFIHQTTKEFLCSKKGETLMEEHLGGRRPEKGPSLILKYFKSYVGSGRRESTLPPSRAMKHIINYAWSVEENEGIASDDFLGSASSTLPEVERSRVLQGLVDECSLDLPDGLMYKYGQNQKKQLLLFYAVCELPLSVARCLSRDSDVLADDEFKSDIEKFFWIKSDVVGDNADVPVFYERYSRTYQTLRAAGLLAQFSGVDLPGTYTATTRRKFYKGYFKDWNSTRTS
ncbi:uncharacterized protein KY384_002720 [Bacidia gigantensis]|uniref:uncharacterized protein n=1 Tax=Bacidia gigantensis TaxID=2732470 RepID=UPI001D036008|nr:uncharacterized protein KY384_002720 [Bacidia gigantensis]KAG8532842.1 hypothetical protein KY384_002720 [Bacidia gigantensis]